MNFNSCWERSALFLIALVVFGTATVSSGQDLNAGNARRFGVQALDQGRYSDAERELRRALDEFGKGGNPVETAQTLADLAGVLSAEERYSEAERLLNR